MLRWVVRGATCLVVVAVNVATILVGWVVTYPVDVTVLLSSANETIIKRTLRLTW
jgi:hypothetical protein